MKSREPVKEYRARDLMNKIAEATWQCGDPGMQYDTTINRWHTSKNTARINASNPCSEYMFLDDSACNLASFNLLKFLTPGGQFDIAAYRYAIAIVTTAMEIIVDAAGYPTEMIATNSHDYRPLGLGYANLGALLMAFGLPYDSDAGRDFAATLTSILCGDAYWQSARIAENCAPLGAATPLTQKRVGLIRGGACPGFYVNREPFLDVIRMHRAEVNNIGKPSPASPRTTSEPFHVPQLDQLIAASRHAWDGALAHGERHGFRNSQVTVLAPTGTIGFMMDCDTTGVEPDLALVKYKKLVGGGMIKIVNSTVPSALIKLGYNEAEVNAIVSYIDATGTIEGAPGIRAEHLAVFDCSFKPSKGTRSIQYMGHVKMMAATQPFLSGAISKTVNLPQDCSVDDIAEAYLEAWRLGIKAVAIYRDNSKGTQPLNVRRRPTPTGRGPKPLSRKAAASVATSPGISPEAAEALARRIGRCRYCRGTAADCVAEQQIRNLTEASTQNADSLDAQAPPRAVRHRLPGERASVTHKFALAGHEGYITVGLYPNGSPGEIFIRMAKEGSTVSGLMDSFATAISISLQHGVPLRVLCEKFAHTRFEPSGWTGNPRSAMRSRLWITSSAGSSCAFSPARSSICSPASARWQAPPSRWKAPSPRRRTRSASPDLPRARLSRGTPTRRSPPCRRRWRRLPTPRMLRRRPSCSAKRASVEATRRYRIRTSSTTARAADTTARAAWWTSALRRSTALRRTRHHRATAWANRATATLSPEAPSRIAACITPPTP